jgi:outer membrane protein TolC
MSRQASFVRLATMLALMALVGCQPQQPFYFHKVDADLAHFKNVATDIEYPDVESDRLPDVSEAHRPFTLTNRDTNNVWDLPLEEAIQTALTNNKVMRNIGGQVQGPPDYILRNPEIVPTIYDPALAESNPRTGPEAALSAFDAQFSSSVSWQETDAPQNSGPGLSALFPNVSQHDLASAQMKLSKVAATGGQFALTHNVGYDRDRFNYPPSGFGPRLLYPADWNVNLVAEVRQPLLQGYGTQFNRIAGPGATPGVYNGVMIARIRTDIALADFEAGVRDLVSDVEIAYWELYFNYRALDAVVAGRDSALATWRKIYTLSRTGSKGGEAEKEAQAREQYYLFRSTAERALNGLYASEAKLRYLMGLAATDGRLIRPKDEPTTAKVVFDWQSMLNEGLARSVELREQKWIVKSRELELIASKNFLLPKLDMVAQYRWLGMGNRLDGSDVVDFDNVPVPPAPVGDSNAYRSMMGGEFQEWQLGLVGSIPIGFRRELAGVRNAELQLTRERVKLQEGELELSHQLAYAVRELDSEFVQSQTNFNRRVAAQREVEAVAAAYENDVVTLDVLLKAQQTLAQAESDFYRSLVDYNKSITQVHFRKGSLLEYNGVYLAEGPWPGKAYFDARRRATARAASTYLDYGFTQPRVISRGPVEQHPGGENMIDGAPGETPASSSEPTPAGAKPEMVPTPDPQTTQPPAAPPEEPSAPRPEANPQTSAAKRSSKSWATLGRKTSVDTVLDRQVRAVGWAATDKSPIHESRANPPADSTDRSASGWTQIQR